MVTVRVTVLIPGTSLTAIDGYCELLADGIYGSLSDPQREKVGRIRMSGRHLLSLLDNVMEMARLDAGVVHVTAQSVHLTDWPRVDESAIDADLSAADLTLPPPAEGSGEVAARGAGRVTARDRCQAGKFQAR